MDSRLWGGKNPRETYDFTFEAIGNPKSSAERLEAEQDF